MSHPPLVNTEAACAQLVKLLYCRTRRVPIVVVSQRKDKTGPCVKGPKFQEALGSLAKVYTLSGGALKHFNRLLDHFYGIVPEGVRLYLPRMTTNDYPARHVIWNMHRIRDDFATAEDFMDHVHAVLEGRINYQKNHSHLQKLLSPEEADALLFQAARPARLKPLYPPVTKYQRNGRKVLTVIPPKPSSEALQALCDRFAREPA